MGLFDKFKSKAKKQEASVDNNSKTILLAPMTGQAKNIDQCQDPVFAGEIVGKGTMIIPSQGKLYSPVDGTISMLAETGHAIGITAKSGVEILIHIGLDTVELAGKPFTLKASKDQDIKAGDLLLEFDISQIEEGGKLTESPVIITNPDGYDITVLKTGNVDHGDQLIEVK